MSPEEFDNYLTLVGSLLRIGGKQRERIARELRTHLDDRLEDLLARGVPRDEAIRQALAEFGDAAGLAADFVSLSRNRKRRWLMRVTTASVAATILIALGLITFWPGTNAGPGVAQLAAQAPDGADPAEGGIAPGNADSGKEKSKATLAEKLSRRDRPFQFIKVPLNDLLKYIIAEYQIKIIVSEDEIREAGIRLDVPVSVDRRGISLGAFLDLVLDGHGLAYVIKDDLLVITTKEDGKAELAAALNRRLDIDYVETPLRDVIEHLSNQTGLTFYVKSKEIEDLGVSVDSPITHSFKNIRLSTFLDLLFGNLDLVYVEKDDLLVVTTEEDAEATMEVRVYDCRDLIAMPTAAESLHQRSAPVMGMPGMGMSGMGGNSMMPGSSGLPTYGPVGGAGYSDGVYDAGGPPRGPASPAADPFAPPPAAGVDVPRIPRKATEPDPFAPPSLGIPSSDPFGPPSAGAPGGALEPRPATIPRRTKSADVMPQMGGFGGGGGGMDVSGGMMGGPGMAPGGMAAEPARPRSPEDQKAEELIEIITTAVDVHTWQEMGGPGTIGQYNGLIVVSQSARTHAKIEKVLDMLREAAGLPKPTKPLVVR